MSAASLSTSHNTTTTTVSSPSIPEASVKNGSTAYSRMQLLFQLLEDDKDEYEAPSFHLPSDLNRLICLYDSIYSGSIQQTATVGSFHSDTTSLDEFSSVEQLVYAGASIAEVCIWGNNFVNGIQLKYRLPRTYATLQTQQLDNSIANTESQPQYFTTKLHMGKHHNPRLHSFCLEENEYICQLEAWIGEWMDSIRFLTSKGREFRVGKSNGGSRYTLLTGQMSNTADGNVEKQALVGFGGGYGGHVHNLCCYWRMAAANLE